MRIVNIAIVLFACLFVNEAFAQDAPPVTAGNMQLSIEVSIEDLTGISSQNPRGNLS